MPNGRSGGFAIDRLDLKRLLVSVPLETTIGSWFSGSGTVSAADASRALGDDRSKSLGVEEQDHVYYILHVGGTKTWIVVTPDSPLYTALRYQHERWLKEIRGT